MSAGVVAARPSAVPRWEVRLGLATGPLAAWSGALWRPAGLTGRYRAYLHVMHGVLRASVPLMEAARRRCAELPPDGVTGPLDAYLARHVAEERHHDDWLLADIDAAGGDAAETVRARPCAAVARLVGPQYYWVEQHHPVGLLGYIAVLEGTAPPGWLPDVLRRRTGLPAEAFQTLRHHCAVDGNHCADVLALLDRLDLSEQHRSAVVSSALATADAFAGLLAGLVRGPLDRTGLIAEPIGPRS